MGTFLKVVGIIYIVLAILLLILSLIGLITSQSFTQSLLQNINTEEYPFIQNIINAGFLLVIILSIIFILPLVIFGVALFVLGTIYNDVKELKNKLSNIEIVSTETTS